MYQYEMGNLNPENFIEELNKYGAKGYKLFKIMGQNSEDNSMVCLFEYFVSDLQESAKKDPMPCT